MGTGQTWMHTRQDVKCTKVDSYENHLKLSVSFSRNGKRAALNMPKIGLLQIRSVMGLTAPVSVSSGL